MSFKIYLFRELVTRWVDHPMIHPPMISVKMTYAQAQKPEYEGHMTAMSRPREGKSLKNKPVVNQQCEVKDLRKKKEG